jgi:phospholipid transport system substrate-binding protein
MTGNRTDRKFKGIAWALAGVFFLLIPLPSTAGMLTEQMRATVDKVLAILQDPLLNPEARKQDRRLQLQQVLNSRFDFAEMARRSLGSHWQGRTPKEQDEFVKLFGDLLEDSYLDKIESRVGEKFLYLHESQDGGFSEVGTKLIADKGEGFAINYKLRSANGEWKVYDMVIENVSLVNNYRSQFSRILATASFDELLKGLQERSVKEFRPEKLRLDAIVSYSILSGGFPARPR